MSGLISSFIIFSLYSHEFYSENSIFQFLSKPRQCVFSPREWLYTDRGGISFYWFWVYHHPLTGPLFTECAWLILSHSLQAKEEEVHQMRLDIGKLNKIREQIHKKLHQIEDQKAEVEQHKETLKNQILGLERGKPKRTLCFVLLVSKHFNCG